MSTEVKKKKKRGSHDNNKLIAVVAIVLGVIVVSVSVLGVVLYTSGNYVAKLNGQKLYNYEYTDYLNKQIAALQDEIEIPEDADNEAKLEAYKTYFTTKDDNGQYPLQRCKEKALEELRLFKTSYQLAVAAGYELTNDEEKNVESNIDYYINYYYQIYTQYSSTSVTYDDAVQQVCGSMTVKQYKEYAKQDTAIAKYKEAMKEKYNTTEDELRAVYDENVNDYRKVTVQKFFLSTQTTDEGGNAVAMTEEQKAEVKAKIDDYMAKFQSGEFSFEEKIKSDSEESGSADSIGVTTISGSNKTGVTALDDWAFAKEAVDGENVYTLLEDTKGYYIVRCTAIEDFDNSEDSTEGANDSIKNTIKTKVEEEKATAQMREEAEAASGYELSSVKDSKLTELFDENESIAAIIKNYGAKVSD